MLRSLLSLLQHARAGHRIGCETCARRPSVFEQDWSDPAMDVYDEADDMCPNCVTPWKCNGPHLAETERVLGRNRLAGSPVDAARREGRI